MRKKLAVVIGCNGFIGKEISNQLAKESHFVIGIDTVGERATGISDFYRIDTSISDNIAKLKDLFSNVGSIDSLVHLATIRPPGFGRATADYDVKVWEQVIEANLYSPLYCSMALYRNLCLSKRPSILFFSSIYGIRAPNYSIYEGAEFGTPSPTPVSYSVSKTGILGLTRHLANEWAPDGIRVNCISPGGVQNEHPTQFVEKYQLLTPLGRMAKLNEIVSASLFLLSDKASYITGHNLVVDGGWSI